MASLKEIVARNSAWTTLDAVVDFGLTTLMGILVARALGPTKLGAWGYVLWVAGMAIQVGSFGVPAAVRKYLGDMVGGKNWELIPALILRTVLVQSLIAVVAVGGGLTWSWKYLPEGQRLFGTLAVLSILPAALMGIASSMNSAMERLRYNAIPSVTGVVVQAALTGIALVLDWDLVGIAAALLAGRCADSTLRWWFALRAFPSFLRARGYWPTKKQQSHARFPPDLRREITLYCVHATLLLVLRIIVWSRSEIFFLERLCSLEQLAYYSVAVGFAIIPARLALPFTYAAMASLFAERGRSERGAQRFAALYWRYLALIVFPTSVGLCALSGPLIRVFYGAQYAPAAPVLTWAMVLALIPPLAQPATELIAAANGQAKLLRWNLVASVLVLVLDWVLVKHFCSMGAAFANGMGQTIATIGVWIIAGRGFGLKIPYAFALRLLLASLLMGACVGLVLLAGRDIASLAIGVPLGAVSFAVALRLLRVLEEEDVERLQVLRAALPGRARGAYGALLTWLAPNVR